MIKAIFFDIDGTLVSFKTHEIAESTLSTLHRLRAQGIKLFIASGRHRLIMDNLADFPFDGYVCMNGALLFDGDEVVYSHPMDAEDVAAVVDYADSQGIPCVAFAEREVVMNCHNDITREIFKLIRLPEPEPCPLAKFKEKAVCQFTIFINEEVEKKELMPMLKQSVTARWHPEFTDIDPVNISKADGIAKMIARYGIKKEEVMAFGDGGNDVEMLEFAGIGVAMGNALPSVQAHADYVTSTVDEDGVSAAVRHFGLI